MEQIELVMILLKNTYINFLLGAGTSYNKVDGKMHFPLMWDLLNRTADIRISKSVFRMWIRLPLRGS